MNSSNLIENWEFDQLAIVDPNFALLKEIRKSKTQGHATARLGEMFLEMSQRLYDKSFGERLPKDVKDDFVAYGALDAVQYYDRFNEEISQKPMIYIYQIIKSSFAKATTKILRPRHYEDVISI